MASPQLEDGYTKIANELLEKLYQFPMGGPHLRIALWLIRFSYGFHEKMIPLNISRIARDTGISRQNCQRAIRGLQSMNIVHYFGNEIGIIKDWEQWVPQGEACLKASAMMPQGEAGGASRRVQNMPQGEAPLKKERKDLKKLLKKLWAKRFHDTFWPVYPRKKSKDLAFKYWMKLPHSGKTLRMIMVPLKAQVAEWGDKQFIPHPSTWLNQKRWEDEIESLPTETDAAAIREEIQNEE